jgi:hypothetical protein
MLKRVKDAFSDFALEPLMIDSLLCETLPKGCPLILACEHVDHRLHKKAIGNALAPLTS